MGQPADDSVPQHGGGMKGGLDLYVVKARLRPALLVLLPISITIISFNPDGIVGWPGLIALILEAGGAFLLANIAGDAGKAKEEMLFADGRPTELMLSHTKA